MSKKTAKKVKEFTPAKRERMRAMLGKGKSVYSIAKELNLTPSVARYHANKLRGARVSTEQLNKFIANAPTREDISRALDVSDLKDQIEGLQKQVSADSETIDNLNAQLRESMLETKAAEAKIELLKELLLEASRR